MAEPARRGVPEATVARLPGYLRALTDLADQGRTSVSSDELAQHAGVGSAQLRKDLSHLGSYGVRGVGYDVDRLSGQIAAELGLTEERALVIVGMGNLGRALAAYSGLSSRGFRVVAVVDNDPQVVGTRVEDLPVSTFAELADRGIEVSIGVIATPAAAAQEVADALVSLGARSILTFAPTVLTVPDGVTVREVDLATELQILAFHEHHRLDGQAAAEDGRKDAVPQHVEGGVR